VAQRISLPGTQLDSKPRAGAARWTKQKVFGTFNDPLSVVWRNGRPRSVHLILYELQQYSDQFGPSQKREEEVAGTVLLCDVRLRLHSRYQKVRAEALSSGAKFNGRGAKGLPYGRWNFTKKADPKNSWACVELSGRVCRGNITRRQSASAGLLNMHRLVCLCFSLFLAVLPLFGTTVLPPQFPELVNGAEYIVRAKVASVDVRMESRQGKLVPFTYVTLEVLEVIAGNPPSPLILRMLGGRTSEGELVVHGAPTFALGDEDVLFVRGNGRSFTPLYALMHGKYRVKKDSATGASYVTRSNEVPLTDIAEVSLPMAHGHVAELQQRRAAVRDALTPAEFVSLIRTTRGAQSATSTSKAK
jgi:hypothetical protein